MADVMFRIGFYERIGEWERDLPFVLATYPGLSGKVYEPADCLSKHDLGTPVYPNKKVINKRTEFHAGAAMGMCEIKPDGKPMQLHKFESWGYPAT